MSKIFTKGISGSKPSDDYQNYLTRIKKNLYYGKLPKHDLLSLPITELAVEIFSKAQKGRSLERLHSNDAAEISRNACVSPCSLVLALLYFEKLKICNPEYLERIAPTELFLVSLMVSSKFLFDDGEGHEVFMDEWAASGSMTVKELIKLERGFLEAIDWKIYVSELSFHNKLKEIETLLARREGNNRGHFTYNELETLSSTIDIHNILNCVVAISVILAATYTAGLLTIVGSVFIVSQVPGTPLYPRKLAVDTSNTKLLPQENINCTSMLSDLSYADVNDTCHVKKNLDITDMLKTTIILASITSDCNAAKDVDYNNTLDSLTAPAQYISWDWWNIPIMNWLSHYSEVITLIIDTPLKYYFLENKVIGLRYIELEEQIQKATKTRIQDQMECSWHKEWIETIRNDVYYYNSYVHHIKS